MTDSEDLPVAGTAVLLRDGTEGLEVLLMRRPERGSFADAWVFPGGRIEDGDRIPGAEEVDDACRAAVRETFEEVGIVVSDLVVLSCWHPPVEAAKRIRTWFFVGADPGGEVLASDEEVVDVVWTTPTDALARHAAGEWTLFPPTWVTLHAHDRRRGCRGGARCGGRSAGLPHGDQSHGSRAGVLLGRRSP